MPIKKILLFPTIFAGLLALILLFSLRPVSAPEGNIQKLPDKTEKKNSPCGIENCHGLDITCGPNSPEMCTDLYQLGDACRKYARCETMEGKCQLVPSPGFDECKSCVLKCQEDLGKENMQIWQCESACHQKISGGGEVELE